ncbi:MAG: GLPGLI family protein [Aestuariibaculum sp.]
MKIRTRIGIALMMLFTGFTFAQSEIQGVAHYEFKRVVDMTGFGNNNDIPEEFKKRIEERMRNANQKKFSLIFNQTESYYNEEKNEDDSGRRRGWWMVVGNNIEEGPHYRSVKDQLLLQEQVLYGKKFLITDSLPRIDWEMTGETKQIGNYVCFKATAKKTVRNMGRRGFMRPPNREENGKMEGHKEPATKEIDVEAWYTLQIPVNQGPSDYWGLPGLILEVNAGETSIYCTKIVLNPSEKQDIERPKKGKEISKKDYEALVRKKVEEEQQKEKQFRIEIGH